MTEPLTAPEFDVLTPHVPTDASPWKRVPLIGRMAADRRWLTRVQPVVDSINAQLQSRPAPDPARWGQDARRVHIGQYVCRIAADEMGWDNDHFIPEDPMDIVLWSHEDALDAEIVILTLCEKYGVELERAEISDWFCLTLGQVVDQIMLRADPAALSFFIPSGTEGVCRVDVPHALAVLCDKKQWKLHDQACDTLDSIDPTYTDLLPLLTTAIQNHKNYARGQQYAQAAVLEINQKVSREMQSLLRALADPDNSVRQRAIRQLRKCDHEDALVAVPTLIFILRNRHIYVNVQIEALLALADLLGWKGALGALLRRPR